MKNQIQENITPNPTALLPLVVFLLSYLAVSFYTGDFYKMPIIISFIMASVLAVVMSKGGKLSVRIEMFCRGAAHSNIMLMILIFVMAGAFAYTAKAMGAIDATVNLSLRFMPSNLIVVGIFLAACFISISVGTSVGTIIALAPIACGLAAKIDMPTALLLGVTVSGAMFGDNLSFISDTTIVASRSQGCKMSDKFKVNIHIALPIAVITAVAYIIIGNQAGTFISSEAVDWIKVVPYLTVLLLAVLGLHVLVVLLIGILFSGAVGIWTDSFDMWQWLSAMNQGILGMGELIIVTLLASGMMELMRFNGGFSWMIRRITQHIKTTKGAEFSIATLVSFSNICTANNTIALIMSGPIAKDIAKKYKVDPRRSASLLDIFSCFVQGTIPYGAQLLMASNLGKTSPIDIMQYLYYPYLLGIGAIFAIIFNYPAKYSNSKKYTIK